MVMFELVKIDLFLLNASLLISIPLALSVHVGGLCFFDTVIEYVFFAFNANPKDSFSFINLSRICWRFFLSQQSKQYHLHI